MHRKNNVICELSIYSMLVAVIDNLLSPYYSHSYSKRNAFLAYEERFFLYRGKHKEKGEERAAKE